MKFAKVLLVVAYLLVFVQPAWTQKRGILGYLDPQTGAFKPLAQVRPKGSSITPVSPTTGTFQITYNITISSSIPTSDAIRCTFSANVTDDSSGLNPYDEYSVPATRNGSTATCSLAMSYSWLLSSPTTDTVGIGSNVDDFGTMSGSTTLRGTDTAGSISLSGNLKLGSEGPYSRYSNQPLPGISVPPNGTITSMTLNVTL